MMELEVSLTAFAALSQRTRLETVRLLVRAGPDGLPAGDIARALGIPHNTMSAHLAHLSHANLVRAQRQGRTIAYSPRLDTLRDMIDFLVSDCCDGQLNIQCELPKAPKCLDSAEFIS